MGAVSERLQRLSNRRLHFRCACRRGRYRGALPVQAIGGPLASPNPPQTSRGTPGS